MSEPSLQLNIDVTGGPQAVDQVVRVSDATEKVAQSTQKAAPATKSLADAYASLGSRSNVVREGVEGISMALRGGEGAAFGAARAFKAIKEVFDGGLVSLGTGGALIAGLTAFLTIAPRVWEMMNSGKKSAEELAAEAKKASEAADELSKVRIEGLKESFENSEAAAKKLNEQLERQLKLQERLDNSNRAAALAENRKNDKLSDDEKAANEALINAYYEERERGRTVSAKESAVKTASDQEQKANEESNKALAELKSKSAQLEKLARDKGDRDTLQAQLDDVSEKLDAGWIGRPRKPGDPSGVDVFKEKARQAELQNQLDQVPTVTKDQIDKATAEQKAAKDLYEEASGRAHKYNEQKKLAQEKLDAEQTAQAVEKQSKQRISNADLAPKIKAAEQAAQNAYEAGDWAAQDKAVADRQALLRAQQRSAPARTSSPGSNVGYIERDGVSRHLGPDKIIDPNSPDFGELPPSGVPFKEPKASKSLAGFDDQNKIDQVAETLSQATEKMKAPDFSRWFNESLKNSEKNLQILKFTDDWCQRLTEQQQQQARDLEELRSQMVNKQ